MYLKRRLAVYSSRRKHFGAENTWFRLQHNHLLRCDLELVSSSPGVGKLKCGNGDMGVFMPVPAAPQGSWKIG